MSHWLSSDGWFGLIVLFIILTAVLGAIIGGIASEIDDSYTNDVKLKKFLAHWLWAPILSLIILITCIVCYNRAPDKIVNYNVVIDDAKIEQAVKAYIDNMKKSEKYDLMMRY